ncbi:MAG: FAD-binding oxidoreductase, partial [Pseudomonadota bacterium]
MNLLYANDEKGRDAPSWYAATAPARAPATPLESETRADVCVVGGGYTGLSAALHLAERGYDVALVEAHRAGWGASGRNGGQLGPGMRLGPEELDDLVGREASDRITMLGAEAIETVKGLIAAHAIDCDYRDGVLYTAHRRRYIDEMRREAEIARERYDHPCALHEEEELRTLVDSPAYCFGVSHPTAGHLHPLKYAMGLARAAEAAGVRVHELSEVTAIDETTVKTAHGVVKADHVILACNGYLGALNGEVASRVMPINNFIIATEPLGEERATSLISNGMAVADSKFVVNYFRLSADHRMIFGGRESYGYRFPKNIKNFVRKAMLSIYPQLADARIDYGWGG